MRNRQSLSLYPLKHLVACIYIDLLVHRANSLSKLIRAIASGIQTQEQPETAHLEIALLHRPDQSAGCKNSRGTWTLHECERLGPALGPSASHRLQRPIEESERRIVTMKSTIGEAERSMRELKYLFMAEQQHISDMFVDRHKAFLARVLPNAKQDLEQAISSFPYALGPRYRRRLLKEAQEIAKRYVLPWLRPEQEEAEQQYRRVSPRFVEMGNNFLKKLAEGGIPEFARMPHALDLEAGFRVRSTFTFADFIQVAQPVSPLRWLADLFLSLIGALFFIKNDAREFLVTLLEVNSTRVQSDILNRIQESHAHLEVEIRKLLHEVSRMAEQALSNARNAKQKGVPAVESALQTLNKFERELLYLSEDHGSQVDTAGLA